MQSPWCIIQTRGCIAMCSFHCNVWSLDPVFNKYSNAFRRWPEEIYSKPRDFPTINGCSIWYLIHTGCARAQSKKKLAQSFKMKAQHIITFMETIKKIIGRNYKLVYI